LEGVTRHLGLNHSNAGGCNRENNPRAQPVSANLKERKILELEKWMEKQN
jgi:hypothetical protein